MDHKTLVKRLAKDGQIIADEMNAEKAHLLHMSGCICEEAGEIFGKIKKHVFNNKPFNLEGLIEELGDLEFYLEGLRQGAKITREEILEGNIAKLTKRYSEGSYSDKAANERADKNETV